MSCVTIVAHRMSDFFWIVSSGILMSCIALVGSVTLLLKSSVRKKLILPLVALSTGSLLGGAFFHLLPVAVDETDNSPSVYVWFVIGFALFFVLEQFMQWHHCHRSQVPHDCKRTVQHKPFTYMILIADGLHNFMGGLAIAGAFLIDVRLGWTAWFAAAAHEVPQELGDFGILIHGGFKKGRALFYNFLSATSFLLGGLITYALSVHWDLWFLLPLAAGNFVYIAAADLIPEIKHGRNMKSHLINLLFFVLGLMILYAVR